MDLTLKLTANFTLGEMLRSATADKHGIIEQYTPDETIINALKLLCENTLQPLRNYVYEHYQAIIKVNSGYRCKRVNGLQPQASKTSQHMQGEAADIILIKDGKVRNDLLVDAMMDVFAGSAHPYDQIIWEHGASAQNPAWVHISYNSNGPQRRQQLRPKGGRYIPYNLF